MNDPANLELMDPPPMGPDWGDEQRITLCETLDRVLNKGVVVAGELIISVAGIDLVYLNLQVLLASVETAHRLGTAEGNALCGGVG